MMIKLHLEPIDFSIGLNFYKCFNFLTKCIFIYAVILIGRITRVACPSVCSYVRLLVSHKLLAGKQKA